VFEQLVSSCCFRSFATVLEASSVMPSLLFLLRFVHPDPSSAASALLFENLTDQLLVY
jgi:hypothetical protein